MSTGFPGGLADKRIPRERSLGWEDSLEKGKATHPSILAWRMPWTIQLERVKESDTTDWASLIAQMVKNPPAVQETPVQFLCREDPLEKG